MEKFDQQDQKISDLRENIVALARRFRQSSRTDGETWTQLMVLGAIERAKGDAMPTQIAAELELHSSNLAQVLSNLDARLLIQRDPDSADKRKIRLSLTDTGLALVRATRSQRDGWLFEAMQTCLSAQEREQLLAAGEIMCRLSLWSQNNSRSTT